MASDKLVAIRGRTVHAVRSAVFSRLIVVKGDGREAPIALVQVLFASWRGWWAISDPFQNVSAGGAAIPWDPLCAESVSARFADVAANRLAAKVRSGEWT